MGVERDGEIELRLTSIPERDNTDTISEAYELYRNIHAGKDYERQLININYESNSDLFTNLIATIRSSMLAEDPSRHAVSLQLFIRSLYPGWSHKIRWAQISIHWNIDRNRLLRYLKSKIAVKL